MSGSAVASFARARPVVPSFAQPRYVRFAGAVGEAVTLVLWEVSGTLEFPVGVVEIEVGVEEVRVEVVEVMLELMVEKFPTFLRSPNKLMYAPSPPQYSLKSPLQRY